MCLCRWCDGCCVFLSELCMGSMSVWSCTYQATPTYLGSHFHIKIGLILNTIGITNCMCYFYWTFNISLPVYQQV